MNAKDSGVGFDSTGLADFLEHIAAEERFEMDRMKRQFEAELQAVRAAARRESRRYHHETAEKTRIRLETERARKLSRARNDFRKRRWQILETWRQRARHLIEQRLRHNWNQAERQWAWCRYWLLQGEELKTAEDLRIELSADCFPATVDQARDFLEKRASVLSLVEGMEPGLMLHARARTIDGRLGAQVEPLLRAVDIELADWLHATRSPDSDT